jgi:tetratricopeptide (TPR) repeat protein
MTVPDPADALRRAAALLAEDPAAAEQLCRALPATAAASHAAHHLRGLAVARQGRAGEAVGLFDAAIAADPRPAAPHYDRGVALAALGRLEEAVASYDAALARDSRHAEAWNNRGVALAAAGRIAAALASYAQALRVRPGYVAALANRGNAELAQGATEAAIASYDAVQAQRPGHEKARRRRAGALASLGRHAAALADWDALLQVRPDDLAAQVGRAHALFALGRTEAALDAYDAALAIAPARADLHFARANTLHRLGRAAAALEGYDRALALHPDYPEALNNRGNALLRLDRTEEALASFEAALARRADYPEALNNASVALRTLGRLAQSLAAAERAVALRPDYADALTNRGNAQLGLGQVAEGMASYLAALRVDPGLPGARFNLSLGRLLTGDFAQGWQDYEARWRTPALAPGLRGFTPPLWLGDSDPAGRTILLHAEQGNGDTLQFCRYASLVAARGARVLLEVQPLQVALMRSLDGPAQVLARGAALPEFDLHCPLLSLPLAFGTTEATIPARVPYLAPPPERARAWAARLGPRTRPRLGLAWSGSLSHKNDRNRSLPLDLLRPLLDLDVSLHCLQRELRVADVPAFATMKAIAHYGRALADFADTAALVAAMDLVVAVDTAVAHLAGALGKPVWILLPAAPDWRWLLDRADSPWYPTARLFRQRRPGDWSDVLAEVFAELRAWRQATRCPPEAPT